MAWDVHLHVVFACDTNDGVAALARKHLPDVRQATDPKLHPEADWFDHSPEAVWFLEGLSRRSGDNLGPKGGLSLWGIVGNHTRPARFVEVLRPFWEELLRSAIEGGPLEFEHILVFYEEEQSGHANVLEIYLDDSKIEDDEDAYYHDRWQRAPLVIRHHVKLPFTWRQA